MKSEMVEYLVRLLESGLEAQENPSAIKAQIVKAIKAMQLSLKHGEEVRAAQLLQLYRLNETFAMIIKCALSLSFSSELCIKV